MSQVIKIKRGGISGLSGASTVQGELIIATGSLGNNVDGPFLLAHGDSLGLVAGAVFTGSTVPTITDSELNGILFYDDANSKFVRLDTNGNQSLDIEATGFSGDTDGVSEGSTNLYYTDARVKTKLNTENVVSGSKANVLSFLNVEDGATADQTGAEIKTALFAENDTNNLTDALKTKLDGIEANATADQTAAEIRTLVDSATDSNVFTDADHTKLDGIEANATADQTGAEIKTALFAESDTNNLTDTLKNKLDGIETGADVTDAANVTTALGSISVTAHNDVTSAGSGIIISDAERTKLNGIETGADVTDTANVKTALNANLGTLTIGDSNDTVSVPGNLSVGGTLTTVSSNEVNIGDRIIVLNTADSAGDAGIQVHDTDGAQTGSLLWDTDGNYWKAGVIGGTDYRLVEWDGETAGAGDFVVTNADGRIDALATTTAGDMLISDGDGTFTVTNEIDGGTY